MYPNVINNGGIGEGQPAQFIEHHCRGVAHDFNNFLAIMLGNISLCRKKLGGNETVYSMMNNIENSIIRAKELANQLLFYAQDGSPTQKWHRWGGNW